MAIQSNRAYTGSASLNCAYSSNNGAGNTSIALPHVLGLSSDPTSTCSCTDTLNGSAYTFVAGAYNSSGGDWLGIFVLYSILGGSNTVEFTCTAGGTAQTILYIAEEGASSGTRVANGATHNGSSSNPTVSLASTVTNDVVIALGRSSFNNVTQSVGNIGTNTASSVYSDGSNLVEDGSSSGGTINVNTVGADLWWCIVALAMMPAVTAHSDIVPMVGGGRNPRNSTYLKMRERDRELRAGDRAQSYLRRERDRYRVREAA
jgi:hypothetical protein